MATEAERKTYEQWVQSMPPEVRAMYERLPCCTPEGVMICYRDGAPGQASGHVIILAYSHKRETGEIRLQVYHGADSTIPGARVTDRHPDRVRYCGCGKWEAPSPEQVQAAAERLEMVRDVVPLTARKPVRGQA